MTQLTAILKTVHFLDVHRAMEFELTSMGQIKKKKEPLALWFVKVYLVHLTYLTKQDEKSIRCDGLFK